MYENTMETYGLSKVLSGRESLSTREETKIKLIPSYLFLYLGIERCRCQGDVPSDSLYIFRHMLPLLLPSFDWVKILFCAPNMWCKICNVIRHLSGVGSQYFCFVEYSSVFNNKSIYFRLSFNMFIYPRLWVCYFMYFQIIIS